MGLVGSRSTSNALGVATHPIQGFHVRLCESELSANQSLHLRRGDRRRTYSLLNNLSVEAGRPPFFSWRERVG
jgi:hypothetical protein